MEDREADGGCHPEAVRCEEVRKDGRTEANQGRETRIKIKFFPWLLG